MSKSILVVSHAHPDFSKGGGEVAAYNAYLGFKELYPDGDVRFLASLNTGILPGKIVNYKDSEYLLGACVEDNRFLRNHSTVLLKKSLESLFENFKPEIVNFHHYFNIGVDAIVMMRRLLSDSNFVMTLHEFLAICLNDGQMIKRNSTSLCTSSNEFLCGKCFPEHDLSFFAKRKNSLLSVFSLFDQFISPSEFLRKRYIDWGIPSNKISTVENGQLRQNQDTGNSKISKVDIFSKYQAKQASKAEERSPNIFGYFGQINPYKGLDVVLMALKYLVHTGKTDLIVEINGANLDSQRGEFRDRIQAMAEPLMEEGVLRWNGPYERTELESRMARIDWVLVPSVWWENSPMIIQEAYIHGKPVICSNIGGMKEKVLHGKTGIHVNAGSVTEWAEVLNKASQANELRNVMVGNLPAPPTCVEMAEAYVKVALS